MALVSLVAVALASLFGYSLGAAAAGRRVSVVPGVMDLMLVPLLWIGVIMARDSLGRWLVVPVGLLAGVVLGAFAMSLRVTPVRATERGRSERLLTRVGNFQSRLLLSLLYFALFSVPSGIVRLFHDPLTVRRRPGASAWVARQAAPDGVEEARRQY